MTAQTPIDHNQLNGLLWRYRRTWIASSSCSRSS